MAKQKKWPRPMKHCSGNGKNCKVKAVPGKS